MTTAILTVAIAVVGMALAFIAGYKLGWAVLMKSIEVKGERNLTEAERETLGRLLLKALGVNL
jgi:membrane protein DedA with SNARE-associated domain